MLGPLAVWTEGGEPVSVPGAKVRALLADLLVAPGRLVSADRLIDDLWGDGLPADPQGALHSKVSQLRRALEAAEPGGRELVRYRFPGYLLAVSADAVDAGRFEQWLSRARTLLADDPREAAALFDQALALWRGPALGEFADAGFARTAAARLEEARLAAVEDRIEARLALAEHTALVGELDGLVEEHPLRERLRGQHMRALYRAGRQADALESYQRLRLRLSDELGLEPAPEISQLHQSILTQQPSLDAPPPVARPARPHSNLPAARTSLVGRDAAVERVCGLVREMRQVTLTGAGGVGKTRLALAAARALVDDHPDGVWVVELTAGHSGPERAAWASVAEQVADVLGLPDDTAYPDPANSAHVGRVSVTDRLVAALQTQRLLLVLDNCEQVAESVADLADTLLGAAAGLRILATSRRPLGLTGEQLWSVPPLAVPEGELASAAPDRLTGFSAVQLFVERVAAADPGFALTADTAAAAVDVCRRLDGLPLAVELAAARTRTLGVHELAARLDDRFRLLTSTARDVPERQQTLRAVVDWSWELLSPAEQTVLRRLSVFAGAPTLPAIEAVCGADAPTERHNQSAQPAGADADLAGEPPASQIVEVLADLVDHSLVVVDKHDVVARYRLLETIRAYGGDRLGEAGEVQAMRRRHAAFYTEVAEDGDARLRGPQQGAWLARFDTEAADLRAAAEWAVCHDGELALRLVGALAWYWYLRGRQSEACQLLDLAVRVDGAAPPEAHAKALAWLGALGFLEDRVDDPTDYGRRALQRCAESGDAAGSAYVQLLLGGLLRPWGQAPDGPELIGQALETFHRLDEPWGVAAALSVRGWLAVARGEVEAARRDGEEAHALFREVEDRWGQVRTGELLGHAAEVRGDYDQAAELHRSALDAAEALGLWAVVAQQLSRLGRLAALTGDYPQAEELHHRALRLTRDLALEQGTVFARVGLGLIARRQGHLDDAEAHFHAISSWHRERGFHAGTAFCLAELGFVAELRGDAAQAHALHLAGLDAARRSGDQRAVALALEGLAGAAAADRDGTTAATLLGAASAARAAAGGPLPPAERGDVARIAVAAATRVGTERYDAAFTTGQAMSLEAAIHLCQTPATAPR